MKKVLLGSTALVGASLLGAGYAAAGEAPSMSFGGWARFEVSGVDQDLTTSQGSGYQFETDSHGFYWSAKGTADSGMTYTASTSTTNAVGGAISLDEVKLTFSDTWGTIVVGDDDGADDSMMVGGYSLLTAGYGYDGGYGSNVNRGGALTFASLTGDTGDATKVSYFTPRMSGLQVGASFTPDSGASFTAGLGPDNNGDRQNGLGLGANYIGSFGDVGIKLGATLGRASAEPDSTTTSATSSTAFEDVNAWSVGGYVTFSGFSLGVGHGDNGDSLCTTANALCDQGDWWDIAGNYSFGTNKIAIGHLNNDSNPAGAAIGDSVDIWTVGINHTVASAPGLSFHAEVVQFEVDRTGTASDNDATYYMIGTNISF
jgi:hypothetical protein